MPTEANRAALTLSHSPAPPSPGVAVATVVGYILAYIGMEIALHTHDQGKINISPWIPQAGFGLALLIVLGWRVAPALVVASLFNDFIVHDLREPWPAVLISALVPAVCYGLAAWALSKYHRFNRRLRSIWDLSGLLLVGAAGIALVAIAKAALVYSDGSVSGGGTFADNAMRYWIGAAAGASAVAPFLLLVYGRRWRLLLLWRWDSNLRLGLMMLAWWIVFRVQDPAEINLFFLFFVPVIWAALRHGIRGAASSSFLVLVGAVAAAQIDRLSAATVIELQLSMLTLAIVSCYTGITVDERRRVGAGQSAMRDQLSYMGRVALTGEIGSAVAHELNQPLAAMANYAEAAKLDIDAGAPPKEISAVLDKAIGEAMRAGEILGRLRKFLRHGEMQITAVDLAAAIADALALLRPAIERAKIVIDIEPSVNAARVLADRVHLVQVLVNLVSNAIDAMSVQAAEPKLISIGTRPEGSNRVAVLVADSGRGVPPEMRDRIFDAAFSTKPAGMGLRLGHQPDPDRGQGRENLVRAAGLGQPGPVLFYAAERERIGFGAQRFVLGAAARVFNRRFGLFGDTSPAGARDFLAKPFMLNRLLEAIDKSASVRT